MRNILFTIFIGVVTTGAELASGVELTQASNRELLGEVGRRMGFSTTSAAASYVCDGSGYLYIHLTNAAGKTESRYYTTGGVDKCTKQSGALNQKKNSIVTTTIAAVCDSSGYLYRVTLLTDGKFGDAPYTSIGGYEACLAQAKSLNGA